MKTLAAEIYKFTLDDNGENVIELPQWSLHPKI